MMYDIILSKQYLYHLLFVKEIVKSKQTVIDNYGVQDTKMQLRILVSKRRYILIRIYEYFHDN